jgi:hypothetical protein
MKSKYIFIILISVLCHSFLNAQHTNREAEIWVNGACGMCEDRIERTALGTRGVSLANWDVETKLLKLTVSDKFKEDRIHYNLASVGHDTKKMLAPDPVYNALPACCHYRPDDGHDHSGHEDHELHSSMVMGNVLETDKEGRNPLPGANIFWAGSSIGVISDEKGFFEIPFTGEFDELVVSYVGYGRDTIHVHEAMAFEVEFNRARGLEEVKIVYRTKASSFDLKNAFNVQNMSGKELLRALKQIQL